MKTLKDFKKDINKDKNLKERFMRLKNKEEAVSLAKSMGYEISLEELENDEELNEDLLEAVAGGRKVNVETVDVKVADIGKGARSEIRNNTDVNKLMDRFKEMEDRYRK